MRDHPLLRRCFDAGAVACLFAIAACAPIELPSSSKMVAKPGNIFASPDWAAFTGDSKLRAARALAADDFISADGTCAGGAPVQAAAPVASNDPADPATTAAAGTAPLAASAAAGGNLAPPRVSGGISLGMSECEVAQRAGTPERVDQSAGERGERSVVLTYMRGDRPGIYRFRDGRLVSIDRVAEPEPEKPKKPVKTAKPKPKPAPAVAARPAQTGAQPGAAPPWPAPSAAQNQPAQTQWPTAPGAQTRTAQPQGWPDPPPVRATPQ